MQKKKNPDRIERIQKPFLRGRMIDRGLPGGALKFFGSTLLMVFVYFISMVVADSGTLSVIFSAAILLVTWLVGRMRNDYARYIGMGMGIATGIMVLLVGIFALDIRLSVGMLIVGIVLSALLAFGVEFFVLPLSYLQTELVQFEDDDYYYYVKAVPKMAISRPEVQVKKLNIRKELENTSAIPNVSGLEATNELPEVKNR